MGEIRRATRLERREGLWVGHFPAMASPCEVLVDTADSRAAARALEIVSRETWRIEAKYSRYREDSEISCIRRGAGEPRRVDDETARLLDFADRCHRLSEGRFDVTSGVLRRVWRFDGGTSIPSAAAVAGILPHVGWDRVEWTPPVLTLRPEMEIDFGGLGKEYAVDRGVVLLAAEIDAPALVNLGGDLACTGKRSSGEPWRIGIEAVRPAAAEDRGHGHLSVTTGALATSGDARRFLLRDGRRYSHVLDPRTGWPVEGAPRSVTVRASTCTEAGMLATFALLAGSGAEELLESEAVEWWCDR